MTRRVNWRLDTFSHGWLNSKCQLMRLGECCLWTASLADADLQTFIWRTENTCPQQDILEAVFGDFRAFFIEFIEYWCDGRILEEFWSQLKTHGWMYTVELEFVNLRTSWRWTTDGMYSMWSRRMYRRIKPVASWFRKDIFFSIPIA